MKKMFGIGWKFLFVVCILIGIVFLCFLFKSGENKIQAFAEQALRETIACDYHQRYAAEVSFRSLPTGKKIKEPTLMTEQGEETIVFKDSMEEHLAHQLATQYILAQCRPINPDQFNALFKDKMKEKADVRQTGIVYRYEDGRQYSGNDSVSCKGAICSEVHALVHTGMGGMSAGGDMAACRRESVGDCRLVCRVCLACLVADKEEKGSSTGGGTRLARASGGGGLRPGAGSHSSGCREPVHAGRREVGKAPQHGIPDYGYADGKSGAPGVARGNKPCALAG